MNFFGFSASGSSRYFCCARPSLLLISMRLLSGSSRTRTPTRFCGFIEKAFNSFGYIHCDSNGNRAAPPSPRFFFEAVQFRSALPSGQRLSDLVGEKVTFSLDGSECIDITLAKPTEQTGQELSTPPPREEGQTQRKRGVIDRWIPPYGFIQIVGGPRCYFHVKNFMAAKRDPKMMNDLQSIVTVGLEVECDLAPSTKQGELMCTNIVLCDKAKEDVASHLNEPPDFTLRDGEVLRGKVHHLHPELLFGFIETRNGRQLFFHVSEFEGGNKKKFVQLRGGEEVEFTVAADLRKEGKQRACAVILVPKLPKLPKLPEQKDQL